MFCDFFLFIYYYYYHQRPSDVVLPMRTYLYLLIIYLSLANIFIFYTIIFPLLLMDPGNKLIQIYYITVLTLLIYKNNMN